MYSDLHLKHPLFLPDFNEFEFPRQSLKNAQMSNFMKMLPLGAELFHVDRRTDRQIGETKVIVAFRNFAKAPLSELCY